MEILKSTELYDYFVLNAIQTSHFLCVCFFLAYNHSSNA